MMQEKKNGLTLLDIISPRVPILILLTGSLLTILLFIQARNDAFSRFSTEFEYDASLRAMAIQDALSERLRDLDSTARFIYNYPGFLRRDKFANFVLPFIRSQSSVESIAWVPRVQKNEKGAFELLMAENGYLEYQVIKIDKFGNIIPVEDKDEYFPICYVEPEPEFYGSIGFDLGSDPDFLTAINTAVKTGKAISTDIIPILFDKSQVKGFIACMPVFINSDAKSAVTNEKSNIRGFVLSAIRLDALIKSALSSTLASGLQINLISPFEKTRDKVMYSWSDKGTNGVLFSKPIFAPSNFKNSYIKDFEYASRNWRLEIVANNAYLSAHLSSMHWFILPLGFALTLISFSYTRSLINTRQKAEQLVRERTAALEARESMFEGITKSAQDAIIMTDKDGNISYLNESAGRLFGWLETDMLGKPFMALFSDDKCNSNIKALVNQILSHGISAAPGTPLEADVYCASKQVRPVELSISAIQLNGHWCIVAIIRDISERKQAQERIQNERRLLRTLIDNLPQVIYAKDAKARKIVANKADLKIMGCKNEDEVVGKTDFDFYPKELAEKFYADDIQVIQSGEPIINREELVIEADGTKRWILTTKIPVKNDEGEVIGLVGIGHDFTERKNAEELVRRERILLRTVIDNIPNTIYVKDYEGRKTLANKAEIEMMGCKSEAEAIGKTDFDIYPREIAEKFYADDMSVIREGKPVINREEILIDQKGNKKWLLTSKLPLKDEHGKIIGLVGIGLDITYRKKVEEELHKAKEKAEEASRAKSEFLANMSHEIRTPMNGIIGMTGLLLDTKLTPEQRDYVETIRNSGEALLTILNDILDFSKVEAGRLDLEILDFNIRGVIEDTSDLMAFKAQEKGLEFISIIEPDVPHWLKGDPGRLRQVIINLAGNAIKFTPQGEVTINVKVKERHNGDVTLLFEVSDTGIGIPEDKIPHLFQPFSQLESSTTRRFGGTGLGLSISKRLVELMNGEIGVRSVFGKGSTFWFTAKFEVIKDTQVNEQLSADVLRGKRVLIVDDNSTNRRLLSVLLRNWGCIYDEASNGFTAIEKLKSAAAQGEPYDIGLLDMNMPEMSGEELGKRIKSDPQIASIHLIILTSINLRSDIERLRQIGFVTYITKPIRQIHLQQCLSGLFSGTDSQPIRMSGISEPQPTHTMQKKKFRILLAEDNITNQKVALKMLERLGYHADAVANGKEAIKALETIPYDLVLMDCQMPEMDGYEATRIIRDTKSPVKNHNIPVIAMTAYAMQGDRELCLRAGMNDYIAKPVTLRDLESTLNNWLNKQPDKEEQKHSSVAQTNGKNIFDPSSLLNQLMGDKETVKEILAGFLVDIPKQINELEKAIQASDIKSAERYAHTIKGAAANVGAYGLKEFSGNMERLLRNGDIETPRTMLKDLNNLFDELKEIIKTYIATTS